MWDPNTCCRHLTWLFIIESIQPESFNQIRLLEECIYITSTASNKKRGKKGSEEGKTIFEMKKQDFLQLVNFAMCKSVRLCSFYTFLATSFVVLKVIVISMLFLVCGHLYTDFWHEHAGFPFKYFTILKQIPKMLTKLNVNESVFLSSS